MKKPKKGRCVGRLPSPTLAEVAEMKQYVIRQRMKKRR